MAAAPMLTAKGEDLLATASAPSRVGAAAGPSPADVGLHPAQGNPMQVMVDAPGDIPPLPLEAGAYRMAIEAVTNSARHSGTDVARVRIDLLLVICIHHNRLIAGASAAGRYTGHERRAERTVSGVQAGPKAYQVV
jgi:hypothetical protein